MALGSIDRVRWEGVALLDEHINKTLDAEGLKQSPKGSQSEEDNYKERGNTFYENIPYISKD